MTPEQIVIGSLAVWRLSHALVKENGPRDWFIRLRARLARTQKRSGGLFDMFSCVYCLSFWIALIAALSVSETFFQWFGYALALSGSSMLLEVLFTKYSNTLPLVTRPTADNKVGVSTSTTPEQRNDVIGNPRTTNGSVAVKATTVLDV
jgi:hypothetical protein